MLFEQLQKQLIVAMKARNATEVGTIRMLISAAKNVAIDNYGKDADTKLTDADVLEVVKKQVKTHKESIDAFTKAGRVELAQKEKEELDILSHYLPAELSDADLYTIVSRVVLESKGLAFGPLMGKVMAAIKNLPAQAGQADGNRVSLILKKLMSK
ncbi:MAG: GatB/YqeY domain-containing protein [Patescibacteria group bacterium]